MKKFIKEELRGWSAIEVIWFIFCTIVVLALSIYWKDNIFSILGALTGIWCTLLTGKGKRSAFIFGIFNVFFYSYISYKAQYYGEVMLNTMYFMPMNIVGWILWTKHMNKETYEVEKNKLTFLKKVLIYTGTGIGIFLYGLVLERLGGSLPYVDSMSTVISITAQILSVLRLAEQWILWIIVDAVTVVMWAIDFTNGGENASMIVMWSIYLINGIIMFIKWNKSSLKH